MISESHISFDFKRFFIYLKVYRYLKTFIIMAKIDLKFLCSTDDDCYIKCNEKEGIIDVNIFENGRLNTIYLDKSTAIKFAKTLRTEINKIEI